jgi:multimeric flavodoxin WrbA
MPIKVLAFAGSPRRGGNSETLLDWVLDVMRKEADTEVEKVCLDEANVHPCRGCNACEVLNMCVQRDGMDVLHDKITSCHVLILAAPIFCMGINAQSKALVDRFQVFRSRKYVLKLPVVNSELMGKRQGVFLSTAGQHWDYVFDGAIPTVKCFFHVVEIRDRDIHYLMINGVDEKGAILNHPTAKTDAETMAKDVIRNARHLLDQGS